MFDLNKHIKTVCSYIIMECIQNLQNYHQTKERVGQEQREDQLRVGEKGVAKFNRKSPSHTGEKKKKNGKCASANEQKIVYISPGKGISQPKQGPPAATLSDVMNRFTISREQLFDYRPKEQSRLVCPSGTCKAVIDSSLKEIKQLKQQLQQSKEEVRSLQQQHNDMNNQLSHLQDIRIFLFERESFIAQILQSNIRLNESIQKVQNEKLAMAQHFGVLLQEKLDCESQYEKQYIQWSKILHDKNQEIGRLLAACSKLQSTPRKSSKHIQKENLAQERTRTGKKSLSGQVEFASHDLNSSSKAGDGSLGSEKQWMGEREGLQKMIKQLQERVRYGNIEMDILKKQKEESSKLTTTNECLKKQNRKLLDRVHYLTRTFSRNSNSDSSLELSLSPNHK